MRKGFTMIELIFVIVIIGILAAVAIPKLASTRTASQSAKQVENIRTCITENASAYLLHGAFDFTGQACTEADCFAFASSDSNMTVTFNSTHDFCAEANTLATDRNLTGSHAF